MVPQVVGAVKKNPGQMFVNLRVVGSEFNGFLKIQRSVGIVAIVFVEATETFISGRRLRVEAKGRLIICQRPVVFALALKRIAAMEKSLCRLRD